MRLRCPTKIAVAVVDEPLQPYSARFLLGLNMTKAVGNGHRLSELLGWLRLSFLMRGGNLTVTPLCVPSPSQTFSLHHAVDVRDGTSMTITSQWFRSAVAFAINAGVIVALYGGLHHTRPDHG